MDFNLLKTELESMTGTDDEVVNQLNAAVIEIAQDIQTSDINNYLNVTGKVLAIRTSIDDIAVLTVDALNTFNSFDMSNPTVAYVLSQRLDYLISIGLLEIEDATYVLSLGIKNISRASQLGLSAIDHGHILHARTL